MNPAVLNIDGSYWKATCCTKSLFIWTAGSSWSLSFDSFELWLDIFLNQIVTLWSSWFKISSVTKRKTEKKDDMSSDHVNDSKMIRDFSLNTESTTVSFLVGKSFVRSEPGKIPILGLHEIGRWSWVGKTRHVHLTASVFAKHLRFWWSERPKGNITLAIGFRGSCDWWGKAKCREERPLKLILVLKKQYFLFKCNSPKNIFGGCQMGWTSNERKGAFPRNSWKSSRSWHFYAQIFG